MNCSRPFVAKSCGGGFRLSVGVVLFIVYHSQSQKSFSSGMGIW